MKLSEKQRLLEEDFKDQKSWIGKLISPLNSFMTSVYQVLNKNIDFSNNFNCSIREIDISEAELAVEPLVLQTDLKSPVRSCEIMAVSWSPTNEPTITPVDITAAPWVIFDADGDNIRINKILGLPSGNNRYRLKLRLLPE